MITVSRDPSFWRAVLDHPEVRQRATLGFDLDIGEVLQNPRVTPIRAEHGGFLFVQLDTIGRVAELHTLFTPEGWGREVAQALKEAVSLVFASGAQLITTYEVASNWRSKPPRTFRFEPAGPFEDNPSLGESLRTWILTRNAWEGSPACKRMVSCPHS